MDPEKGGLGILHSPGANSPCYVQALVRAPT